MNGIAYIRVRELANTYIKDGKLIKYRWYDNDVYSMDYRLNDIMNYGLSISEEDLSYMKKKGNLVIETDVQLEFVNCNEWFRSNVDNIKK